jgi:hypothetical protein
MDINALVEQFKSTEELKVFVASQYKQIIQLSKKNKDLEEKNQGLIKQVREQSKQELTLPKASDGTIQVNPDMKVLDDAKTIAQIQLRMLKELSFDKELTLEEAKRVEIFNRILNDNEKDDKSSLKADAKVLKETDLLKLVEGNGTN